MWWPCGAGAGNFVEQLKNGLTKALPVLVAGSAFVQPSVSNALTKDELSSLSYLQVKGTGLANRCPEVSRATGRPGEGGREGPRWEEER